MGEMMEYGMAAIIIICMVVLLMGGIKKKSMVVFSFLARMATGCVGIYVCNYLLAKQEISLAVGWNPVSLLTVGSLGISGLALLYGILFYESL